MGAEIAAQTFDLINENDFIFKTYFINNRKVKNKIFNKIINELLNNLKALKFFLKQKNFVIVSSLWKSSILSFLIKLLM